jgi:urease
MFGPLIPSLSITFVSQASLTTTIPKYNLRKRVEAVKDCRKISKKDMKFNDVMPKMEVDAERYEVKADGVVCTAEPGEKVALGQEWFVY